MTYDELQLFVALVDHAHFGRAARHAHVSVSTLSRAIRRVEREAGAVLVDRSRSGVHLTRAGHLVDAHARSVLSGWESVRRAATLEEELTGTLRVYCTVSAAQTFVPDVFASFRVAFPAVHLDLATGYAADALTRLLDGDVDVAVAALPDKLPRGVEAHHLTSTPLRFVTAAGQAGAVDWRRAEMVLPAHGLARARVDAWFKRRRITPTIAEEVEGHEAVLSLVALGVGIGVVPGLVLEGSALRNRIDIVAADPPLPLFDIGVCVRQSALREPVVGAFWSTVAA